ncbi:MAG: hypothetical protein JNJ83_00600 [Verrucomicrobiaceae bacterium]|nr:hypothetical protein [Verrucomicrobiaceae bacterium]
MRSLLLLLATSAFGALPSEPDYYAVTTYATPPGTALEVGSIDLLPDGRLALGTRRGEIWLANPREGNQCDYQLFASGLHEVLGLAWKDGSLYATTRYEVTKITDQDGDGRADVFDCFSDGWGVSGDYHEYAVGSRFDKRGDLWVTLCLTGSFSSAVPFRGWALRIGPDGKMTPTCSGIRSPGGVGFDADGEVYYCDNQGPWHGSCTLQHLVPGSFQGHPGGNQWYELAPNMGKRPVDPVPEAFQNGRKRGQQNPDGDHDRMVLERKRIKELLPPAVYLVHGKIGNSATAIVCDESIGKFGPFNKQLFIADQSHSNFSRVYLETINGIKQGVVFPFRSGFKSGLIGGRMTHDGVLYTGGSDRGWGARGGQPFCFEKLEWTGKVPFEMHEVHAEPDGFTITFTQPVDPQTARTPASYSVRAFTYPYREEYGGPEVDETMLAITSAQVAEDAKSVRLKLDRVIQGHIHELHLDGLKSTTGNPLLHSVGYYTLNEIPVK